MGLNSVACRFRLYRQSPGEQAVDLATQSDEDILAVVNPLMDNLMEGSTEIDYEKHVRDFTDRLKSMVSEEGLKRMCEHYQADVGYFTDRELLSIFRRSDSVGVVWRQATSKSDDELIASVVVVEQDGRYLVDHALVY